MSEQAPKHLSNKELSIPKNSSPMKGHEGMVDKNDPLNSLLYRLNKQANPTEQSIDHSVHDTQENGYWYEPEKPVQEQIGVRLHNNAVEVKMPNGEIVNLTSENFRTTDSALGVAVIDTDNIFAGDFDTIRDVSLAVKKAIRNGVPGINTIVHYDLSNDELSQGIFENSKQTIHTEFTQESHEGIIEIASENVERAGTPIRLSEYLKPGKEHIYSFENGAVDLMNVDPEGKQSEFTIRGESVDLDAKLVLTGNVLVDIIGGINYTDNTPDEQRRIVLAEQVSDFKPHLRITNSHINTEISAACGYVTIEDSTIGLPMTASDGAQVAIEKGRLESYNDEQSIVASGENTQVVMSDTVFDKALVHDGATMLITGNSHAIADSESNTYITVGYEGNRYRSSLSFETTTVEVDGKLEKKIPFVEAQIIVRDKGTVSFPIEMLDEEHLESNITLSSIVSNITSEAIVIREGVHEYPYTWRELRSHGNFQNGGDLRSWHEQQKSTGKKPR